MKECDEFRSFSQVVKIFYIEIWAVIKQDLIRFSGFIYLNLLELNN